MRHSRGVMAVVFVLPLLLLAADGRAATEPAWGKTVRGLRIGIAPVEAKETYDAAPVFLVTLHNDGDADLVLNLGTMLGNGARLYADEVCLVLIDAGGREKKLKLQTGGRVAGRVDDLVVPLPAGAQYVVRMDLARCWCPDRTEFEIRPGPGKYTIAAAFEGRPATNLNADTRGIGLLRFWRGRIESASFAFEIAAPPPAPAPAEKAPEPPAAPPPEKPAVEPAAPPAEKPAVGPAAPPPEKPAVEPAAPAAPQPKDKG